MANAILTTDARDVYYKNTNQWSFKVGEKEFTVRVSEDSHGEETFWLNDDDHWVEDGFPEEVEKFLDLISYGYIDHQAMEGEEFDLEQDL